MNKKGLSTIIVTLILIVLSLVAVGAVWIVVSNIIKGQSDQVGLDKLNFNAEITALSLDNSSNNVSIVIERKAGEANLKGMKFYFYNDTGAEVMTEYFSLGELGQKRFTFHLAMNLSNLNTVSIVPIFNSKDGKDNLGNVADSYDIKKGGSFGNYFPNENATNNSTCTPANYSYSCLGNISLRLDNCGIYQNITCNSTQTCFSNATRCGVGICSPTTCSALGYTCGTYSNGTCAGTLNCGTCANCVGGNCVEEQICDYYFQSGSTISQIQNAINNAIPGKTICLQRGAVFSASDGISITNSGTSANPITICASSNGVSCNEAGINPKISITGAGEDVKGIEFRGGIQWIIVKHLDFEGINDGAGLLFSGTTPASHVSILACNISRFNSGWLSNPWVQTTPPNYIYIGSCEYPLNIFDINANTDSRGSGGYGWFSNSVMAVNYKNTGSDGVFDHNVYFSTGPRTIPTQNMTFECGTYTDSSLDSDGVSIGLYIKISGYHTGMKIRNNTFYDDKCNTYVIGAGTSNDGLVGEYAEAEIYNNVFETPCPVTIASTLFKNTKIYNNLFNYKNYAGGWGDHFISLEKADYSASTLGNNEVYNNNFICNERYCPDDMGESFFINVVDQGSNNKFFNNLFYSNNSNVILFENTCNQFGTGGADFDNNFVYTPNDASPQMLNCSGGSGNSRVFNINPKLKDALHGDYTLLSNSPLINNGRVLGAPGFDFLNNPRGSNPDIGAFEYV
jgi:hypothetical protein